ncbi:hypothetical protein PR202_ga09502 [Eleusine coracana subsp. coracana]|uniref:Uncharacterized protein n=1 Tax=Eleusine coracana subsp. coracana TaxID=191504 RepID=A0AAV5C449_ELECO|nr:hypothetical protein PR202_ga09502 [Eleusine coracana subsp. coracana]
MIVIKEFTVSKDPNDINSAELSHLHHMSLLVRFLGPFYGLIISTVLLVTLALHYPMTQGQLAQLEAAPFICSLIGVIPGVLCLIPLDGEFVAHLLRDLAFNIATLVGATSRLLDAIVICFHKTRESANYFRTAY